MRRFVVVAVCLVVLVGLVGVMTVGCSKGAYVGSVYSNKYHDPSCIWAENMAKENQVWFATVEEAQEAGYVPCPSCEPPE